MSRRFVEAGCVLAIALALFARPSAQTALGTTFSYQGRLTDAGVLANGSYDLQFTLFDAATAGNQVGPVRILTAVAVSDGIFTVQLDFGSVFTGSERWLQVAVRQSGGTTFTDISPRQQLTAAPHAIYSLVAGDAQLLGGQPPSAFLKTGDPIAVGVLTGQLPLAGGGTGASTAAGALTSLGAQPALTVSTPLTLTGNALGVSVGTTASSVAAGNDARFSDARTPLAGSGNYIQNQTGTPQSAGFTITGTATAGSFVGDGSGLSGLTKIGANLSACTPATAGNVRYNAGSKTMQYCEGTAWADLAVQRQVFTKTVSSAALPCVTSGFSTVTSLSSVSAATYPSILGLSLTGGSVTGAANFTFRITDGSTELAVIPATYVAGQSNAYTVTVPILDAPSSGNLTLECKADASVGSASAGSLKLVLY